MQEYLHNEKATRESFDEHGYFITGDRVTLLDDGFIKFGDRAKDMLKVGGENVAASEIEQVIAVVPGVREAAVVAKKHPMLDEVPVVFIIPAAGVEGAPKDLHDTVMAACRGALADFKVPREIRFVDEMPRSTLEKVAKAELRKMLGEACLATQSRAKRGVHRHSRSEWSAARPPAAQWRAKLSMIPERDRAERLQQMLVQLVAHLLHHRERLGVGELHPVGPLLHQCRVDIHDRRSAARCR